MTYTTEVREAVATLNQHLGMRIPTRNRSGHFYTFVPREVSLDDTQLGLDTIRVHIAWLGDYDTVWSYTTTNGGVAYTSYEWDFANARPLSTPLSAPVTDPMDPEPLAPWERELLYPVTLSVPTLANHNGLIWDTAANRNTFRDF